MPSDDPCDFRSIRVGVICEGPTDAVAIRYFVHESLRHRGIEAEFVNVQPEPDRTSDGGWGNVLLWLENNPPKSRLSAYLGIGLFDGDRSAKTCDVLIFHIDSDILDDFAFATYMQRRFSFAVPQPIDDPISRGAVARSVLKLAGDFDSLAAVDREHHIEAPAVESTEAWCVAAFAHLGKDPERLRNEELRDAFMTVLHRSEQRPVPEYHANVDKHVGRRRGFCRRHATTGFSRLENQCHHYRQIVNTLVELAPAVS